MSKRRAFVGFFGLGSFLLMGFGQADLLTSAERDTLNSLLMQNLAPLGEDPANPVAILPRAIDLGKVIFFDPKFSGKLWDGDHGGGPGSLGKKGDTGKISCASCHVPESGFSDSRSPHQQISLGAGWGRRKSPTLQNVAHVPRLLWDGSKDSLQSQFLGPLESPVEMNSSRLFLAQTIYSSYRSEYEALFGAMPKFFSEPDFPRLTADQTGCQPNGVDVTPVCQGESHGIPGDHHEFDHLKPEIQNQVTAVALNVGRVVAAYERTLKCDQDRLDRFTLGDQKVLTREEIRGLKLFLGKAHCVQCHTGPLLTDHDFYNVGLQPKTVATAFDDRGDLGAEAGWEKLKSDPLRSPTSWLDPQGVTARRPLRGAFKTPGLRCVKQRPSYMHTGQLRTLNQVVEFFNRGGDPFGFEGTKQISPLGLSESEQKDLVAFLEML